MIQKKRQRLHIGLVILGTLTVTAGVTCAQVQTEVLVSEDFEGQGENFARAWTGRQFERDTVVFKNGRASLRMDQAAGQNTFDFDSPGFPAAVGQNYRISFWIRADERVQVQVGAYPEDSGSGLVGGHCVTSLNWRKIVCGGRVSGTHGFTGGPTRFWWLIRNRKKKVTLWIDDFGVEKAGDFATDAGWTPMAAGKNLIPNGSFEVDPSRHYVQWGSCRNDRGPNQNWEFSPDAAVGSRSLKVPAGRDDRYGWNQDPPLEMIHPLAFDSGDAEFTLSASVKAVGDQPRKVTLMLGPPSSTDVPIPPGSITCEMTATGQWTRHQKTFQLPRADDGKYWLYVRGGNVLLDGLMLARGKSSIYVPRASIEATLTSSRPWRVYEPGDPLTFTLRAVRADADAPRSLHMTLLNYRQQPIRTLHWPVKAKPQEIIQRKVVFDELPQGCYRAELRMVGKPAVLAEITFSIMPQPRRVPYIQSNWGVATIGGIDFNTHDWDFPPMFRRLGFHWARVLSAACLEDVGGAYVTHRLSPEQGLRAAQLWVRNLRKHGMGIYAILTPRMKYQTSAGNPDPPKTDEEYADYEANVREIVARFGDQIDYWEVSNEPALPVVTPENYGRMVRETVRILRETDPGAKIVSIAGGANGDREWIEEAFRAGAIDGVDGISFHYAASGGPTRGETLERYRPWREWALRGKERPLEVWDSEEHIGGTNGPSFYPTRVQSATGLQDLGEGLAYPARFCRDFKAYLYNSAMNVRTICFNAEYSMVASGFERGFWERDGGLKPAVVASYLAAQRIQTMKGGGLYRTAEHLFGALVHDQEQSILAVWSKNYTGTTQLKQYKDPFDMLDPTPRPVEDLEEISDFFRDVHPVKVRVPDGTMVLDTMGVPVEPDGNGRITLDMYPQFLVVERAREENLLQALGADLKLPPVPR